MTTAPPAARLRPGDLAGLASVVRRTRKLRAMLPAPGISIAPAAIVAAPALAPSAKAALLAPLTRLATNPPTVPNAPPRHRPHSHHPEATRG